LIEQRLEGVVISAINDSDSDGMVSELQRGVEAAKAGTDDHNMGRGLAVHAH
jgi:hypothetical protein